MAKISNTTTYPTKASPSSTDYVIGTDALSKETKTFTLQSIANLYAGSGSGTVTSVGLNSGTTGLTITSDTTNPITTTGTFTLGGTLVVANGGTGLSALGTRSQVMAVNDGGNALEFIDPKVIETIEANEAISKGDPLYIVSWNNGTSTAVVGKADASNPAKMPCVGLAQENLTTGATGSMMVVGVLDQLDVNAIPSSGPNPLVNDVIYVAAGGGLTSIKPTGTNLIQNIAIVLNASAQGTLQITAIGRTNDLPNLPEGSIWLGDSNGVPSALGIGANTYVLTSDGTTASWAAAAGGGSTISVQNSGGTPVTGISTLNFADNLSVATAPGGIATIDSSKAGISPFPIYQATDSVSTGGQTIIRQSVCESDVTLSKLEYFSIGASANPINFAIYAGKITSAGSANLRVSGTNATSVDGINIITFSSPYTISAGQDIVIVVSSQDTQSLAGSTSLLSNTSISRGGAGYTSSFPGTLDGLTDTYASSVATGVCTHIY